MYGGTTPSYTRCLENWLSITLAWGEITVHGISFWLASIYLILHFPLSVGTFNMVKTEPSMRTRQPASTQAQLNSEGTKTGFSFGRTPRFSEGDLLIQNQGSSSSNTNNSTTKRTDKDLGPVREGRLDWDSKYALLNYRAFVFLFFNLQCLSMWYCFLVSLVFCIFLLLCST